MLLDFLGAIVRDFFNKRAEQREATPEAMVIRIHRVTGKYYEEVLKNSCEGRDSNFRLRSTKPSRIPTREEIRTLQKLCKKLLKLTR